MFLKSKKKQFSVIIKTDLLFDLDEKLKQLFREHKCDIRDKILVSEYIPIREDSLGKKETRHFVWDGEIQNSSRTLFFQKHHVPQKF